MNDDAARAAIVNTDYVCVWAFPILDNVILTPEIERHHLAAEQVAKVALQIYRSLHHVYLLEYLPPSRHAVGIENRIRADNRYIFEHRLHNQ